MKALVSILKTHPVSIFFYLLYIAFSGEMLSAQIRYRNSINIDHGDKLARGEGIMYGYIFSFMVAVIFFVIMLFNALLRKTGNSFYYRMCLFAVFPIFLMLAV